LILNDDYVNCSKMGPRWNGITTIWNSTNVFMRRWRLFLKW
jgi:hypothetical protein